MTLTGDHLAWQQRVFKETNASSKFLDQEKHTIRSTGKFSKQIYNLVVFIRFIKFRNNNLHSNN